MNALNRPARVAAVVFAIVFPSVVTWIYFHVLADSSPKLQQSAYAIGKVLQFVFPLIWVWLFLKQRLKTSGIAEAEVERKWSTKTSHIFGIGVGAAVVLGMFVICRWFPDGVLQTLQEEVTARVQGFSVDNWQKYLGLTLFYAVVHSFMEEYYFRWFVFGQLRNFTTFVPAMIISGLAFMAHHVVVLGHYFNGLSRLTLFLSFAIAVGGLVWAWQYEKSNSLIGPWISHAIVDAGIFAIGYQLIFG